MKVSELRNQLKGLPGNLEIYVRDHDQSEYEINGEARYIRIVKKKDRDPWQEKAVCFDELPETYLAIQL